MKINTRIQSKPARGYALMLTMLFLAITLLGFGSIMYWVSSSVKVTKRNNLYVSAQAAAESATENVLTVMMRDFTFGTLKPESDYRSLIPNTQGWPVSFTFQNTNGVANQTTVAIVGQGWSALPSQFKGLYGDGQTYVIASTASSTGQNSPVTSTVAQTVWFGNIPLFQFAIFYNQDMEINPGSSFTVNGHVHSNYNIWATGSSPNAPLIFSDSVDATGFVTNTPSSLDPQNYGHRSGNVTYSNTNSPVSNTDSLTLPIGTDGNNNPTNVTSILNLPPSNLIAPQPAAYSTNGQIYLYNESDLVISNSASGINGNSSSNVLTVYYQNQNQANPLTPVQPDVLQVTTMSSNNYTVSLGYVTNQIPVTTYKTNIIYYTYGKKRGQIQSIQYIPQTVYVPQVVQQPVTNVTTSYVTVTNFYYSFITNQTFYDYREKRTVQAVQVDVGNLNAWLANSSDTGGAQYNDINSSGSTDKGHTINSIYVYSSVGNNSSTLPAVRLTDGQQLPAAGLTVSTPLPIYVKGDYNTTTDGSHFSRSSSDTTYTRPAALLGDAITILSTNWNDSSYTSSTSTSSRSTADITINAATLEGIVPSNGTTYSGGVENFLRLLENWSGHTIYYNGSIVVMFPSQYATSPWNGSYYGVPSRKWGFDTNFEDSSRLPPLTPQVKATIRGNYVTK